MISRVTTLLTAVVLAISAAATAQPRGAALRGTVLDPSGAPAGRTELRIINEATNEVRRTTSDQAGRYSAPDLPPGTYRIEVEDQRYRAFSARAVIAVNQDLRLDLPLALGTVSAEIDVRATFIPIDRDSPALTTRLDNRQITDLPLDGRNFLELTLLAPGTAPAPQGSASSVRGDFAISVNGAREDFTNYLLDGIYNVDPKLGTASVRPPVDAVREFEVRSSTYDATFGRNGGGQINVVTRAGTNRLSGTAYEFLRDSALASRNFFAPEDEDAPDYNRNQFGGSLGGPIKKDRTFFFVDYERTRLREGITHITNVPTAAERTGDFSQSAFARPHIPGTATPFPGGTIPTFLIDPRGRAIANLFPAANRNTPFSNFVSSPTLEDDIHQIDARVDHSISGGARITARYSLSDRSLFEPFAGTGFSTVPGFGNDVARTGHNALVSVAHQPSSTLVNDVRFGYNRVKIGVAPADTSITNATVGLPALSANPRDAGLSLISISGYSPLGHEYNNPQASTSDTFQLTDTASWSRGSHLVKFGGEWYSVRQSAFRDVQARGFLNFIDQYLTGNALADLLLGFPVTTGGARLDNPQNLRANNWSLFAHDDWRATPRLTVSAGLRYDYAGPPVDKHDRAALYDVASGQLVPVGTGTMPRGGYEGDRNNLAPRAGFAWTVNDEESLVVRGGYGIYYNQGALATSEGLFFNPPYFNLRVYFPFQGLPPIVLGDPFPASFPIPIPQSATAYQRDLETP
ncbi:MAG: carboxypeptidase regulatory-like domain-containing protein [Vicinamibacterales bacterium]